MSLMIWAFIARRSGRRCEAEADRGDRKDMLSSEEREEIGRLRRENFELRGTQRQVPCVRGTSLAQVISSHACRAVRDRHIQDDWNAGGRI